MLMLKHPLTIGSLMLAVLAGPLPANAQTWSDRGYLNVSGWFQPSASFSNTVRPIDFSEASEIDNRYHTGGVPGFEADGGVRVWRNLAVGVGVSRFSKETTAAVSAQIPHPFFFNKPRAVSGDAASLTRDETAVHLQALWMVAISRRWQLALSGGPSWFSVGQDLVGDVTVTQTYPFDTATLPARRRFTARSRKSDSIPARTRATCSVRTSV